MSHIFTFSVGDFIQSETGFVHLFVRWLSIETGEVLFILHESLKLLERNGS